MYFRLRRTSLECTNSFLKTTPNYSIDAHKIMYELIMNFIDRLCAFTFILEFRRPLNLCLSCIFVRGTICSTATLNCYQHSQLNMCGQGYIALKAWLIFAVAVHNNLHYKSSLVFPQPCKHQALNTFTWLQLYCSRAPWKEAIIILLNINLIRSTPTTTSAKKFKADFPVVCFFKKKHVFLLSFHLSLQITGVIKMVQCSFIILFSFLTILLCSFPDIIAA